jgi:hypothetical protein
MTMKIRANRGTRKGAAAVPSRNIGPAVKRPSGTREKITKTPPAGRKARAGIWRTEAGIIASSWVWNIDPRTIADMFLDAHPCFPIYRRTVSGLPATQNPASARVPDRTSRA